MKRQSLFLLFTWYIIGSSAQSSNQINDYFSLTRKKFKADNAYKTVAFVEKRWRLAGNKGFDESIRYVETELKKAGYTEETKNTANSPLTYRIEKRPMEKKTWEPVDASVSIVGDNHSLLQFSTNRNMIAIHSVSVEKLTAELIDVGKATAADFENKEVKGKILFGETSVYALSIAAAKYGAVGVVGYNLPSYTQPQKHPNSIQFSSIKQNEKEDLWGIVLSYQAKERIKQALASGGVKLNVSIHAKRYTAEELTIVADIKGHVQPEERFVFSAHVQEPGANDNASGVGTLTEMARITAALIKDGKLNPERSLTFLWGDEIVSTARYIKDNPERAKGIKWGMSLDMVGEDTKKTGGSFLIEKMPDPSAIWTRGNDKHTEWGASDIKEQDLFPHYFNDFVFNRCKEQGQFANWNVSYNPFEGGSDHTPFLKAAIPGLLMWHFTDVFYHTDSDRLEMVSKETMKNVGVSALVAAYTLITVNESTNLQVINEVKDAAIQRLKTETVLSKQAVTNGKLITEEQHIIESWWRWYDKALNATHDLPVKKSMAVESAIEKAKEELEAVYKSLTIN
jgi:aminopeptidase YwaD